MERIAKLSALVQPYYMNSNDPAHDWPHIGRVTKLARSLAEGSKVNLPVLIASVFCHDLVNLPKDHPERKEASRLAGDKAAPLLRECGFTESEIEHVKSCVLEHSYSKGLKPSSLEASILQDADRLDALGAIGILRCASVNTIMGSSYYDAFDPMAEKRDLNDKKFMIDHYFVKLFKLPDLMNTEKGKLEGIARVHYMKSFLKQLLGEIR